MNQSVEQVAAEAIPYWQQFGLESDPFVEPDHSSSFILLPQWEQHLDLLQHLSRYSNVLLCLVGVAAVGKTSLRERLLSQVSHETQTKSLQALPSHNPDFLLQFLINEFKVPSVAADLTIDEKVDVVLAYLQQTAQAGLCLIEDAHCLSDACLETLLLLIRKQSESQMPLHIILFGQPLLEQQLARLVAQYPNEDLTHTLLLQPMSLEEIENYLQHRFHAAGLKGDLPFSKMELVKIHQKTGGAVGDVNRMARQVLEGRIQSKKKPSLFKRNRSATKKRGKLKWVLLLVVGGLLATILLLQQKINDYITNDIESPVPVAETAVSSTKLASLEQNALFSKAKNAPVPLTKTLMPKSEPQKPVTEIKAPVVMPVSKSLPVSVPTTSMAPKKSDIPVTVSVKSNEEAAIDEQTKALVAAEEVKLQNALGNVPEKPDVDVPALAKPKVEPLPVAVAKPKLKRVTKVKAKPISQPKPVKKPKRVKPLKPVKAKQPAAAKEAEYSPAEMHLLRFDPKYHTIQLIGFYDKKQALSFVKKHRLGKKALVFKSKNKGRAWYTVIYGAYESTGSAKQAFSKLSKSVRHMKPWYRSLGSVQQAIHKGR